MTAIKQQCGDCEESFPIDTVVCPHDGSVLKPVLVGSLAGTILADRYELVQEIGKGGMGVIYKATDLKAEDQASSVVAVKLLLNQMKENEALRTRFTIEGRAASTLNHPNVVKVHEHSFTADGLPFMVMEWLPGPTLDQLIERGQIDFERAIRLVIQMCDALSHAHRHNIIHRDIKPSNIIVIDEHGTDKAKLVDFGIAKIFTPPGKTSLHLTETGQVFGSPHYMCPEQCMGQKLDARADIYALGCVLYECITGSPPFSGENFLNVIFQHINDEPPRFANTRSEKQLESIVIKTLAKKADDRYQTMADFKQALDAHLETILKKRADYDAELEDVGKESATAPAAEQLFQYYKSGAEAGNPSAQFELSMLYQEGQVVEQDFGQALDWALKAASQGLIGAMAHVGLLYAQGEIVELDYDRAYHWFKKAAMQDDPFSCRMVAHFIESRKVEEGDFETALKWYHRSAMLEEPNAQLYLGYLYFTGENVEKDVDEAIRWLTRAANQGEAHAQFLLGTIYQDENILAEIDMELSNRWLQMAAEQEHPEACRYLSWSYEHGAGVEQDEAEAFRWMQAAAALNFPEALFWIGIWYQEGSHGLKEDSKQSNKYLLKAARLGNANAQCEYALKLLEGVGMARNPQSAASWYKKAIRASHPLAMFSLAFMYRDGDGVPEDERQCIKLLKEAAELDFAPAQFELGLHYKENGILKLARKWWLRAAEQDHEDAKEALLQLSEESDA